MATTPSKSRIWATSILALLVVGMVFTGRSGTASGAMQLPENYPDQPIEFVVQYAPGGGSDNFARMITSVLAQEGLSDATFNVVNREGGSGSVGQAYVAGKEGDNYTLMTMTSALVTGPVVLDLEHDHEDFTAIARLAADQLLIVVPANSEYQTMEDLLAAAQAAPDEVSWGGTGLGGEDSLLLGQIEKASGANLNYISFESGGEVQVALLGGHVDVASSNPNEIIGQLEAGELRPLAVAGDARLEALPDVPTLQEMEFDVLFQQARGVVGPPGMDPEVAQYWADLLKEMTETERWQTEYLERNMLLDAYLGPEEFAEWMAEETAATEALVAEMGLAPATPAP
ncbi:MAG TPA: tripartite tricarboxylate transporter substrate binding protein [Thermomicrobiales bacterium]|nr:tripartite tricarboxylate transporter substrate binding protein [Thermomicrobiales bacterium]